MAGHHLIQIGIWLIYILTLSWVSVTAQVRQKPAPFLRAQEWVNIKKSDDAPTLEKLKGNVIVLCFFNAEGEQLSPALKQAQRIQKAYRHRNVKVLGIHSPAEGWQTQDMRKSRRKDLAQKRTIKPRGPVSDVDKYKIWRRRNIAPIQDLCNRYKLSFPILIDHDRYVRDRYRLKALPTFQLITPDGYLGPRIVGDNAYQKLSREVERLIRVHQKYKKDL